MARLKMRRIMAADEDHEAVSERNFLKRQSTMLTLKACSCAGDGRNSRTKSGRVGLAGSLLRSKATQTKGAWWPDKYPKTPVFSSSII